MIMVRMEQISCCAMVLINLQTHGKSTMQESIKQMLLWKGMKRC